MLVIELRIALISLINHLTSLDLASTCRVNMDNDLLMVQAKLGFIFFKKTKQNKQKQLHVEFLPDLLLLFFIIFIILYHRISY